MKTFYTHFTVRILPVLLIMTLLAACSQELSYNSALGKNERKIDDPKKLADANFLVDAKSFNTLESDLSALGIKNGYSSALVDLAKKNMEEHKEMRQDLKVLAFKKNIKIPTDMKREHKSLYDEAATTPREDFDRNFIRIMKRVYEENTAQFETMATEAADADIRAFAARKLDMLRTSSQALDQVEKDLLYTLK